MSGEKDVVGQVMARLLKSGTASERPPYNPLEEVRALVEVEPTPAPQSQPEAPTEGPQ